MKIITADVAISIPFTIHKLPLLYRGNVHAQWNKTPLVLQDQLPIGNRWSVRGFDGDMTLSAERGWYFKNEVSWGYFSGHQVYGALDAGRVSGSSAKYLLGKTLAGAAIGFRGGFKLGGDVQYDIFMGKPFHKPDGFNTKSTTFGFYVSYSF
jgi:hemolysin activation/secretion protein